MKVTDFFSVLRQPKFKSNVQGLQLFNPFTIVSDQSKIDKFPKTTNCVKLKRSAAQQLSNEWSDLRVLSIESKVRKLCITQGFTLGVKGLTNSTTVKYCLTAFQ